MFLSSFIEKNGERGFGEMERLCVEDTVSYFMKGSCIIYMKGP